jgi:hypothetical protein
MLTLLAGETDIPARNTTQSRKTKHMGDRSPKSNQKKSNQKQDKNNASNQKKQQATAAKQSAGKKK